MQKLGASNLLRSLSFVGSVVPGRLHQQWRSSGGHKTSPPPPPTSSPSPPKHLHGVHAFECPDQVGITAKIAACIARRGASLLDVDVHVDCDPNIEPVFFSRTEFVFDPLQWPRNVMNEDFMKLKEDFTANQSLVRVPALDPPLKIAILASRRDDCLRDLLHVWQDGNIPVEILCVISNHARDENTDVIGFLSRHKIPYYFVPASRKNRHEEEILSLVGQTDFLVLAHYMQILSPNFLKVYGRDIINIHHGLLPSFKGANAYKQAYDAGVKQIGATSHFVVEELDCGPIIEQMVERVSHRHALNDFKIKSKYLEIVCLEKAIKYYSELRIIRHGMKTIVFD